MKKLLILIPIALSTLPGCTRQSLIEAMAPQERIRRIAIQDAGIMSSLMQDFINEHGEVKALEAGIESTKMILKDPDSAKFKDLSLVSYDGGTVLCGYVNAKNGYGGYAGFKRFVAGPTMAAISQDRREYNNIPVAENGGIDAACGYR